MRRTRRAGVYMSVILFVVNRPTSRFERPAQTDRPQAGGVRSAAAEDRRPEGGSGRSERRPRGRSVGRVGSRVTPHTLLMFNTKQLFLCFCTLLAAAVNKLVSLLVPQKLSCS